MNWIALGSRLPTASDADSNGYVLVHLRSDRQWGYPTKVGAAKFERVTSVKHTHWAVIIRPGETSEPTLEDRIKNIESFLNL